MLSTQATTNLNLDQRKKVAKQLSHSTTMEDSHYNLEVHTTKAAVEAYDIVRASAAANKPRHLRRPNQTRSHRLGRPRKRDLLISIWRNDSYGEGQAICCRQSKQLSGKECQANSGQPEHIHPDFVLTLYSYFILSNRMY